MKNVLLVILVLVTISCINQTVKTETTFLENRSFEEVWRASIRAVDDILFTIDSIDKEAGFIGAERGTHPFGGDVPPRLTIMIREYAGCISVDCKVLQKDQFIDLLQMGEKIVREFKGALNRNLIQGGN
ncbi:MAG: hypothetical protein JXB26_08810 [Candidatus Aminicenantes bacterium]|nr:hypothetical protein [Candidatus Aminicenantes bacterium]